MKRVFVQIATGQYSYKVKDITNKEVLGTEIGHCLYALDEYGQVWKWVINNGKGMWIEFMETGDNRA